MSDGYDDYGESGYFGATHDVGMAAAVVAVVAAVAGKVADRVQVGIVRAESGRPAGPTS